MNERPKVEPNERDVVELGEKEMVVVRRIRDQNDPIGKRRRLTPVRKDVAPQRSESGTN